jgi:argininosuccinate lyase
MKLWESGVKVDKFIEAFTVGNDYALDQKLVKFDCLASIAHASALEKAGIISKEELQKLKSELGTIVSLWGKGKFTVQAKQEDCHTAIENHLTEKLGDLGKKIHTARSRNDQVLAMTRLYSKEKLLEVEQETIQLAKQLLSFAKKYEFAPMPGYTHTRKAMPSSVGLWAGSFAETLLDSLTLLESAYVLNNQSPLGAAAGFGTSIELDRALTAKLLGFSKVQNNTLYVQSSRGKIEAAVISALSQVMLDLAKLSSDLIIFSTIEFGFFELPPEVCTGSSIMPQKQNPDVLELIRAKSKKVQANLLQTLSTASTVGSSYHRDLQLTKQPLIDSFEETVASVKAMQIVFSNLKVNEKKCKDSCSPELFAADAALELVKQGKPFRDAYKEVATNLDKLSEKDPLKAIKEKKIQGSTGNLNLDSLDSSLSDLEKKTASKAAEFKETIEKLL